MRNERLTQRQFESDPLDVQRVTTIERWFGAQIDRTRG
jgi:hypothetical protein